jgi:hypothetical protein
MNQDTSAPTSGTPVVSVTPSSNGNNYVNYIVNLFMKNPKKYLHVVLWIVIALGGITGHSKYSNYHNRHSPLIINGVEYTPQPGDSIQSIVNVKIQGKSWQECRNNKRIVDSKKPQEFDNIIDILFKLIDNYNK